MRKPAHGADYNFKKNDVLKVRPGGGGGKVRRARYVRRPRANLPPVGRTPSDKLKDDKKRQKYPPGRPQKARYASQSEVTLHSPSP
jgi:hypothetical protein